MRKPTIDDFRPSAVSVPLNTGIVFNKTRIKKPREQKEMIVTIMKTYHVDILAATFSEAEEKALALVTEREKDFHIETDVVNIALRRNE